MVVRVRFRRGPTVSRHNRKNRRIATLGASFLTMMSISFGSLGLWRIGTDLETTGPFFVSAGLLSHWQVWIGAAILAQYGSFRLARYARSRHRAAGETEAMETLETVQPAESMAANVCPPL
jgi:hypothetical protein